MSKLDHICSAVAHGKWNVGFSRDRPDEVRKYLVYFYHFYYDGHCASFWMGPFYISVQY